MLNRTLSILFTCVSLAFSSSAWAQGYPNRPLRIVVPFGAGAPDTVARVVGQQLSTQLGQPVVIDNRPGANGIIGNDAVAKSPPDGYTLLITSVSFAVNPSMGKKLPYDSQRDLIPVSNIADQEAMFLIVNPDVPAKSVKDLVDLSRKGAALSFASIGIGNTTHLAGELFVKRAGINAVHVPYKSGGAAVTAVIAGEVQMMVVPSTQSIEFIKSGKVRALAYTHPTRAALAPEVPTIAEAGVAGYDYTTWYGVLGPKALPNDMVQYLAAVTNKTLSQKDLRDKLSQQGMEVELMAPEKFAGVLKNDVARWGKIIRDAGIRAE